MLQSLSTEMADLPPELLDPRAVETELAERSLTEYIAQAWSTVETAPFRPGYHIEAIADHLEAVVAGELQGVLLITIPFRCTKSFTVNVMFPTWTWLQNPDPRDLEHGLPVEPGTWRGAGTKFLSLSHNKPTAIRDAVRARDVLDSRWYRSRWGDRVQFARGQNQKQRYENTAGGYRLSVATVGAMGEGGDIVIADDLISREDAHSDMVRKSALDTLDQTLASRVNDPFRSVYIVVMQRLHQEDPAGHILSRWWQKKQITHLMLPMEYEPQRCCYSPVRTAEAARRKAPPVTGRYIRRTTRWVLDGDTPAKAELSDYETSPPRTVYRVDFRDTEGELLCPERFGPDQVEFFKTVLGPYGAAGQLGQNPILMDGGLFPRNKAKIVPAAPADCVWCRGWDLAATEESPGVEPAWTSGLLLGRSPQDKFYIADVRRVREGPFEVETLITNTAAHDAASPGGVTISLPQDPGQSGKSQVVYLVGRLAGHTVVYSLESGSKVTRAMPPSAQWAAGNVYLVEGPWNEDFLAEGEIFPNSKFKDQIDSFSRAFAFLAPAGALDLTEEHFIVSDEFAATGADWPGQAV